MRESEFDKSVAFVVPAEVCSDGDKALDRNGASESEFNNVIREQLLGKGDADQRITCTRRQHRDVALTMPPKQPSPAATKATEQQLAAIKKYIAEKPDFETLVAHAKAHPSQPTALPAQATDYDRKIREADEKMKQDLAKESKDSNASDQFKAKVEHHQANPGPVIAENLGQPTSKEENRKRAEELNK